ncbi:MAG: fluoride efflux transporter FluC [Pseudonocardiaceae bacterium]
MQAKQLRERPVAVLVAVSAGGVVGALARYGLNETFPHRLGEWPWATWSTNVGGCLLIGVLMVLTSEVWTRQRFMRPFLGVGVLGGFTTFSTAIVDVQQLVGVGAAYTGLTYLLSTVVTALIAVSAGSVLTRWALDVVIRYFGRAGRLR